MFWISCLCFGLSGVCFALTDTLMHHYHASIFSRFKNKSFWNPEISWKNKYSNPALLIRKKYKGIVVPVIFTDACHLFKFIALVLFGLASVISVPFINWYVDMIILGGSYGMSFTLFYNYLFAYNTPKLD